MSVFTPQAHELAARPPGLLANPSLVPCEDELRRWVERFLGEPSRWNAMSPSHRTAFLAWISDTADWRVKNVGFPELMQMHNKMSAELAFRTSKRYDLQAALDDPVNGAQWDWPLRLIARWHCAQDVHAPVLFRVNKQFEYCWRLAIKTNEIDHKAATLAVSRRSIIDPDGAILGYLSLAKRKQDKHTSPAVLNMNVPRRRELCKHAALMQGFEVRRATIVGTPSDNKRHVEYLGTETVMYTTL